MSFNKISMVFLFLLVVAAITEAQDEKYCSTCECKRGRDGVSRCYRYERKIGGCPLACGPSCVCTRSFPPQCSCTIPVDACFPPKCPNITATIPN